MAKVVLGGMFRDATHYLPRYFGQVKELRQQLEARGDRLELILAEGDSIDETWNALHRRTATFDATIIKRQHNGKHPWHSCDIPERWIALSWVCNGIIEQVDLKTDVFVYVETDLVWDAGAMLRLIDQLDDKHHVISPMCFTAVGDFYDIWGHIKDGLNFSPFPPYHPALGPGLTTVDSAGSCFTMHGYVARRVRYGFDDLVRGLGRSVREHGYSWWVDPSLRVVHL